MAEDFKLKFEPISNEIPGYFSMDFGGLTPFSEGQLKKLS